MASTPIPIAFVVDHEPKTKPESVQELLNQIGDCLTTTFDSSYDTSSIIFGQLGGILPGSNVGPWSNGSAWWFWDSTQGAYVQGTDGVPIGVIMMWGGQGTPVNWLNCDGSEVPRNTYAALFQQIGTTWGAGDGVTTFNLPPAAVAYINAPGFVPDPLVILSPNAPAGQSAISQQQSRASGLACIGGSQLAPLLVAGNLPPMQVIIPWVQAQKKQPGVDGIGLPAPASDSGAEAWVYQIRNNEGAQLNELAVDQTQFPVMPPFATANYIIKYQ